MNWYRNCSYVCNYIIFSKSIFSKSSNEPILSFWNLDLHIIIYKIKKNICDTFFKSGSTFQLHVIKALIYWDVSGLMRLVWMAAGVCVCKCGHLHWSGAVWWCVVVVVVVGLWVQTRNSSVRKVRPGALWSSVCGHRDRDRDVGSGTGATSR